MKKEATASYQWQGNSIIQRVDIRTQDNGRAVAYIYADDSNARQTERNAVRNALRSKGWGTLSDHSGDQFSLRVSGLKTGQELIDLIAQQGFTNGIPQITSTAAVEEKSTGAWNYIREHSLTISGTIATVGNAMSIMSGFARGKDIGQIGQGAAFAVADLPLMIAGKRDDSRQLSDLLRELQTYYQKNGIDIPQGASINVETSDQNKSRGELAKDYLHRYANQIKCSMEVVAAGFTIKAGHKQNSGPKKYVPLIWGSGFLASLLIPEKKIDDEKYAHASTSQRAWMKIQANPLMIGGILGYSNTIATYTSAVGERNRHLYPDKYPTPVDPKTGIKPSNDKYGWDFAIPTVMIGANGTYAISKKSVGGDIKNDAMVSDVYSIAAQILNKLPDDKREAALQSTAKFLGERTEIKDTHSAIILRLQKEVIIQRQNPWFENTRLAIRPVEEESASPKIHRADKIADVSLNTAPITVPAIHANVPGTAISTADSVHQSKLIAQDAAPQLTAAL